MDAERRQLTASGSSDSVFCLGQEILIFHILPSFHNSFGVGSFSTSNAGEYAERFAMRQISAKVCDQRPSGRTVDLS
jgi:hypothetical protein